MTTIEATLHPFDDARLEEVLRDARLTSVDVRRRQVLRRLAERGIGSQVLREVLPEWTHLIPPH